jgi:hypothetical protein
MGSPVLKSDEIRALLARNFRAMRSSRQWSENQVARRSQVSQKQVNNIGAERTGCGIDALDAVARALGCESWQLLLPDFDKVADSHVRAARFVHSYLQLGRKEQEAAETIVFGLAKKRA